MPTWPERSPNDHPLHDLAAEVLTEPDPDRESAAAAAVGLEMKTLRVERLRVEFFGIGAVIYFLRKAMWTVPGFDVESYRGRLPDLHEQIIHVVSASLTRRER